MRRLEVAAASAGRRTTIPVSSPSGGCALRTALPSAPAAAVRRCEASGTASGSRHRRAAAQSLPSLPRLVRTPSPTARCASRRSFKVSPSKKRRSFLRIVYGSCMLTGVRPRLTVCPGPMRSALRPGPCLSRLPPSGGTAEGGLALIRLRAGALKCPHGRRETTQSPPTRPVEYRRTIAPVMLPSVLM